MALNTIKTGILDFFGLEDDDDEDRKKQEEERWKSRRQALYRRDVAPGGGGDMPDAGFLRRKRKEPHKGPKKPVTTLAWKAVARVVGLRKEKKKRPDMEMMRSFKPALLDKMADEHPVRFDHYKDELFYDIEPQREVAESHMDAAFLRDSGMDRVEAFRMEERKPDTRRIGDRIRNSDVLEKEKQRHRAMVTSLEARVCKVLSCDCKSPAEDLGDDHSHRPYFTYYITFVQLVILIVTMATYGVAFLGFDEVEETDLVLKPNLAIDVVRRAELGNMWIGPRKADLIHLGAKYSPCMRTDPNLVQVLALDRAEERKTGCCIRDDGSGCVQTVPEKCSKILSTFVKRNQSHPGPGNFTSGAVCGQDPSVTSPCWLMYYLNYSYVCLSVCSYCKVPASVPPFEWDKHDITNWPICESTGKPGHNDSITTRKDRHMTCDMLGRPCCHGIQGECMITTREHCNFVRGYYHEEANLCSQVNCFEQICGMIPFYDSKTPDQFTRVFTTILLHAGLIHMLFTLLFQLIVMRWVEKFIGCIRMMFIYVGSGCIGSLASAVLLPYQVEVGPSGAQFGVLACMYVDIINNILILKASGGADDRIKSLKIWLAIYSLILFFLFFLGLFPWLDNWAHLFGFLFGILISLAVLKDVKNENRGIKRIYVVVISLVLALTMFIILLVCFYAVVFAEDTWLRYFNCIPLTDTLCQDMGVVINRDSTYTKYT